MQATIMHHAITILSSLFNHQQNIKSMLLWKKRAPADDITQQLLSSMLYSSFFWPLDCVLKIDVSQETTIFNHLWFTSVATVFTFLEHFRYHKKYFSVSLDLVP